MSLIKTLMGVSYLTRPRGSSINKNLATNYANILRKKSVLSHRSISTSSKLFHGEKERELPKSEDEVVNITVFDRDGIEFKIRGKINDNLMFLAQANDVDIEGACEASLACSTCHVYVQDEEYLDKLDMASTDEDDYLDEAPFLSECSRLGCQIFLRKDMDGMTLKLPMGTRNMRVDRK